jgi:hypothetical protein
MLQPEGWGTATQAATSGYYTVLEALAFGQLTSFGFSFLGSSRSLILVLLSEDLLSCA